MPRALTRKVFALSASLAFILAVQVPTVQAQDADRPVYVQALIGAAQFSADDLTFQQTASGDASASSENDLSTMPYLGVAVQAPLGGEMNEWGLDGSLLIGLRSRNKRVVATNNQVAISVDSELWLTDISAGLYVAHVAPRWRAYLAAGPAMLFGEYNDDTDEEDLSATPSPQTSSTNSDSEFGIGAYLRGGLEYRLNGTEFIGLCIRGMKTNIQFDSAPDAGSDLNGIQGFLSFSKYF